MTRHLCIAMFLAGSALFGQTNSQHPDQKELIDLEQQMVQMDIKNDNNPQFVQQHVSPDLMSAWPMGLSVGREHFTDSVPGQTIQDEKLDNLTVRIFGNIGIIQGRWWKKASQNGKVDEFRGFFQHVWTRKGENWQLLSEAAGPLFQAGPASK